MSPSNPPRTCKLSPLRISYFPVQRERRETCLNSIHDEMMKCSNLLFSQLSDPGGVKCWRGEERRGVCGEVRGLASTDWLTDWLHSGLCCSLTPSVLARPRQPLTESLPSPPVTSLHLPAGQARLTTMGREREENNVVRLLYFASGQEYFRGHGVIIEDQINDWLSPSQSPGAEKQRESF